MVKVIFIPDYLSKILREIGLPIELILDKEKVNDLENSLTGYMEGENKSNDFNTSLEKIKTCIGLHDFNTLLNTNKIISDAVYCNLYGESFLGHSFITGTTSYNEQSNIIHNTWLSNEDVTFNETYNITLKNDGLAIVEIKEGFTNYISARSNIKYKKMLLSEIISLFAKDKVIDSFLSQVYLQLAVTSRY